MKHVSFLKFYYVLGNLVNFAGKIFNHDLFCLLGCISYETLLKYCWAVTK